MSSLNPSSVLDVEMHIQDLADFVFVRNSNDAKIEMSLGGIEDNKDLFYFCVDLFCKGLVLMFGRGGKVDVDAVSIEQFKSLQAKMANAGIAVTLEVYEENVEVGEGGDGEANADKPPVNLSHIESMPGNMGLNEYNFMIRSPPMIYSVSFDLVRNV